MRGETVETKRWPSSLASVFERTHVRVNVTLRRLDRNATKCCRDFQHQVVTHVTVGLKKGRQAIFLPVGIDSITYRDADAMSATWLRTK